MQLDDQYCDLEQWTNLLVYRTLLAAEGRFGQYWAECFSFSHHHTTRGAQGFISICIRWENGPAHHTKVAKASRGKRRQHKQQRVCCCVCCEQFCKPRFPQNARGLRALSRVPTVDVYGCTAVG